MKYILIIGFLSLLSCGRKIVKEDTLVFKIESELTPAIILNPNNSKEIVFEGTVITSDRVFYQNTIFSSCVVEVNSVFQGNIEERIIEVLVMGGSIADLWVSTSHGQISLPPLGTTGIFRVKNFEKDDPRMELIQLTPFKLLYGTASIMTIFPNEYYGLSQMNIEKEIYQKLESEFGRKRKNIFLPATKDKVAIKYSTENELLLPNRQKGMVYKLSPVQETKKNEYIGFYVHMASTNSVAYFDKGELIVEYNEKAFGDSIISKDKLVYDIPRNYKMGSSSRHNAIPKYFDVTFTDIASNKFKIEWKNTGNIDSCLQLLPHEKGVYSAELYFLPINKEEPINLKLSGDDSSNFQYNYEQKKVIPFEYTATDEIPNYYVKDLLPGTITDILPNKTFHLLDTVYLIGKNFMRNSMVSVYAKGTKGHARYRRVPESHILNRTDTLITMVIPNSAVRKKGIDLSDEWFPISGKIKITKGYAQFNVMTWSEKTIKIKRTAANN